VLDNDTDGDSGDKLEIVGVSAPEVGSVSHTEAGVQYTAPTGVAGPVTFRYQVSDGLQTATATVTVIVRDLPPRV
jgi:hypothetical protein